MQAVASSVTAGQKLGSSGLSVKDMISIATAPAKAWAKLTPWGAAGSFIGSLWDNYKEWRENSIKNAQIIRKSHDEAILDISAKMWGIEIEKKEVIKK
jgi:hypothetical protein